MKGFFIKSIAVIAIVALCHLAFATRVLELQPIVIVLVLIIAGFTIATARYFRKKEFLRSRGSKNSIVRYELKYRAASHWLIASIITFVVVMIDAVLLRGGI